VAIFAGTDPSIEGFDRKKRIRMAFLELVASFVPGATRRSLRSIAASKTLV
jgi:hypothetical protein